VSIEERSKNDEETPMTQPNAIREVFPYLTVRDTKEAMAFYEAAFGATFLFDLVEPSGRVGHAEMTLGPITLMLADAFPEFGIHAPPEEGVTGVRMHLHVEDCDAMAARAVAAGATMLMPPTDQFYGERACRLRDPFGHLWLLGHSIEELTPEEMQRRYTAMMQG
jgi:PhnB protein